MVGLAAVSFWLLMTSNVSLKINDTQAMGKEVINRVVDDSDNPNLKAGVELLEASGLEKTLLEQLPPKYQVNLSYADLYRLCEKYNDQGKLTTKDLGFVVQQPPIILAPASYQLGINSSKVALVLG